MNITSYLANKCFELLLNMGDGNKANDLPGTRSENNPRLQQFYPPWIRGADALVSCNGCGACIDSCEDSLLFMDTNGHPRIDFSRGGCSFCGSCAASCEHGVFDRQAAAGPWRLKATVTSRCLSRRGTVCRTCAEHCGERAITFSVTSNLRVPRIVTERCNGCGSCASPCPAGAIVLNDPEDSDQ